MDFSHFNIKIPSGSSGNIKTICPACTPHNRKPANRNSKDLSVNIPEGVWNCHNCGWKGSLKEKAERQYTKPPVISLPMQEKSISWFKGRGINENTLKAFHISEKAEWMPQENKECNCILFPYIKNGEWVNIKYRDAKKNFKLTKDAELVIFNYDGVANQKKVVITEGEIDAMSVYEAGFPHVCSVPNGASKGNQRLDYLDNSWYAFEEAELIVLATDNDEAGLALQKELARRLGKDRCVVAEYPEGCKDFNEVLIKHGGKGVFDCLNNAKPLPIEGIIRLTDVREDLEKVYEFGFPKGAALGYPDFDHLLNFSTGQLTVITGVPNSGKSAWLDQLLLILSEVHHWRHGVCSFENQPITRHIANLSGTYIGKSFYKRDGRMSPAEASKAFAFLHDHFFWFQMRNEDVSCQGILSRAKQLVKVHGIKSLVIDPWNYMEHKRPNGRSETEYISDTLTELCSFAKAYDVHVFLVAHPTKIKKDPVTKDYEVPNLYDISGSAHFFNKCDNGMTVYRNRRTNLVTVHVQKVRFFFNGQIGAADFFYDVYSGRYSDVQDAPSSNNHNFNTSPQWDDSEPM